MISRYDSTRVRRSVVHFLAGKSISSLAGFFALILVVRGLSIVDFANYSVLIALVETLTALSGLGLVHAVLRFVPELYGKHYKTALRQFVVSALSIRTVSLIILAFVALIMSHSVSGWIGIRTAETAYKAFLVVVVLRSTSYFVSQILESTLSQGYTQLGFTITSLSRLLGMYLILTNGHVGLVEVIWVEAISDGLGLVVMLAGTAHVLFQSADVEAPTDDGIWLKRSLKRVIRYAMAGFSQHLLIMPYGSNTNRLLGGRYLDSRAMAGFGFAQSLYEYTKRYLPAQLLIGVIRPVIVSRYTETGDFPAAARIADLNFKVNALMIGMFIAFIFVSGEGAVLMISNGKFGHESATMLIALMVLLLFETLRQQLEVLVQAVEHYENLYVANLLLSASVLPAVLFLPYLGGLAFPLANILGLMFSNYWVVRKLKSQGFESSHDWKGTASVILVISVSAVVGSIGKFIFGSWEVGGFVSVLTYVIALFTVCRKDMLQFRNLLMGSRNCRLPLVPSVTQALPMRPNIVFGVLSSRDSSAAITQLADALKPHRLIVHHDFSKFPDFRVERDNVSVLSEPVQTAWGDWSLVAASLLLIESALHDPACTHFQLLSESCLPVRPVREYEEYLKREFPDAMIDLIPIDKQSINAFSSHAWRYLTRNRAARILAKRASILYHSRCPVFKQEGTVNLVVPKDDLGLWEHVCSIFGKRVLSVFLSPWLGFFPQGDLQKCWIGGQWFGVSRIMAEYILSTSQNCPKIVAHFAQSHIPDESFFHTIIANSGFVRIAPGNHVVFWESNSSGPDQVRLSDFDQIQGSGKYFSRKFLLDPANPVRIRALAQTAEDIISEKWDNDL